MFKKIAIVAAASALVVASTAQAGAAALSLRANTASKKNNELVPGVIAALAIVGVLGVLEITGAINIVGDDSDSN